MKRGKQGFTLIELLIVVAIIAILAAIAVPNFLEAQTRAKVSRVKADMRTLATAIESYIVDWNRPPVGNNEAGTVNPGPNWWNLTHPDPVKQSEIREFKIWSQMTTPVAYISTMCPADPFFKLNTAYGAYTAYRYWNFQSWFGWANKANMNNRPTNGYPRGAGGGAGWIGEKYSWTMYSMGPFQGVAVPYRFLQVLSNTPYIAPAGGMAPAGASIRPGVDGLYDPTNGTVSTGL